MLRTVLAGITQLRKLLAADMRCLRGPSPLHDGKVLGAAWEVAHSNCKGAQRMTQIFRTKLTAQIL